MLDAQTSAEVRVVQGSEHFVYSSIPCNSPSLSLSVKVCVHKHTHIYICICIYIYIYLYLCIHAYMYIYGSGYTPVIRYTSAYSKHSGPYSVIKIHQEWISPSIPLYAPCWTCVEGAVGCKNHGFESFCLRCKGWSDKGLDKNPL